MGAWAPNQRSGWNGRARRGPRKLPAIDEWARQQIAALELRVADLERRIAGGHAGAASTTDASDGSDAGADPEVVRLLRDGKQVQAVPLVHKQKGSSLTEAKAEVDRLKALLSL